MRGKEMIEQGNDLMSRANKAAEQIIQGYGQGLLTVDMLKAQIVDELRERQEKLLTQENVYEKVPMRNDVSVSVALQICSRALYAAWSSQEPELRNQAYENMRRYLERTLHTCRYAQKLAQCSDAIDDILNQTLFELFHNLERNPSARPRDPAAFIRWTQVAAIHHAHAFVYGLRDNRFDSLEGGKDIYGEQLIDERNQNPEEGVIAQQLQQVLFHAILSLRNPSYRQVLFSLFLAGMEEKELAHTLGLPTQEVYIRKFRAVQALRKNPEIVGMLRQWRE
jgi:RNA polymerase sigma factor (sigma-70 family)